MATTDDIRKAAVAYLTEDVECVVVSEADPRIACSTPLEYPDGDRIVTWITAENGEVLVTDYGKGFERILNHPPQARASLRQFARTAAEGQGVDFYDGRVSVRADATDVGEAIWRVASASAQLAQAGVVFQPKRRTRHHDFERAVEISLKGQQIEFVSRAPIAGASGRVHHATFYLPARPTVIEPVAPTGVWSQVASVYAKFGDLSHGRNGEAPLRYSLVDDRDGHLSASDADFLSQVSDVVPWSEKERLFEQVT